MHDNYERPEPAERTPAASEPKFQQPAALCPTCNGDGFIDSDSSLNTRRRPCLTCHGLGTISSTATPASEPRKEGHSALRIRDGKLETFDPHPATAASEPIDYPALIAEIKRLDNEAFGWHEPGEQPDLLAARKQLMSLLLRYRHEIYDALESVAYIDDEPTATSTAPTTTPGTEPQQLMRKCSFCDGRGSFLPAMPDRDAFGNKCSCCGGSGVVPANQILTPDKTPGQVNYDTYHVTDGREPIPYARIGSTHRARWEAAAQSVTEQLRAENERLKAACKNMDDLYAMGGKSIVQLRTELAAATQATAEAERDAAFQKRQKDKLAVLLDEQKTKRERVEQQLTAAQQRAEAAEAELATVRESFEGSSLMNMHPAYVSSFNAQKKRADAAEQHNAAIMASLDQLVKSVTTKPPGHPGESIEYCIGALGSTAIEFLAPLQSWQEWAKAVWPQLDAALAKALAYQQQQGVTI